MLADPIAHAAIGFLKDETGEQFLERVNPYKAKLIDEADTNPIKPEVAKTFLRVAEVGRMPPWVLDCVDLKMIRKAAK